MADIIVILIIMAALAAAIIYIVRAKKRGVKCVGCSAGETCASRGNPSAACTCSGDIDEIASRIRKEISD